MKTLEEIRAELEAEYTGQTLFQKINGIRTDLTEAEKASRLDMWALRSFERQNKKNTDVVESGNRKVRRAQIRADLGMNRAKMRDLSEYLTFIEEAQI